MAGNFTIHPLLALPIFSIYVRIKQFFARSVSREGEGSGWETKVAAELVPVPVTEEGVKQSTKCQASQRNGSTPLLIQGLMKRQSAPEVF